jgi:hypothetical protein
MYFRVSTVDFIWWHLLIMYMGPADVLFSFFKYF